jgi:hypothetical protein
MPLGPDGKRINHTFEVLISRSLCYDEKCSNFHNYCLIGLDNQHYKITFDEIMLWAKAIRDGKAILFPPLLSDIGKPVPRDRVPPKDEPDSDDDCGGRQVVNVTPIVHYHYPPPTARYPQLDRPLDRDGKVYKDVVAFMERVIEVYSDDVELREIRRRLTNQRVDVEIIRDMTMEDALYWGIPWGLGKRLKRDVEKFGFV